MAVALAELDDLVLDRRAIAGANSLDRSGIHSRAEEVPPDHVMRCGVVRVIPHAICGLVIRSVINEKGTGARPRLAWSSAPTRSSSHRGAAAFRSSAAPRRNRAPRMSRARRTEAGSSTRPAGIRRSPIWMSPPRNVPVVRTRAPQAIARPSPEGAQPPCHRQSKARSLALDQVEVVLFVESTTNGLAVEFAIGLSARARAPPAPCAD